jgi:hypothetical protein
VVPLAARAIENNPDAPLPVGRPKQVDPLDQLFGRLFPNLFPHIESPGLEMDAEVEPAINVVFVKPQLCLQY